MMITCNNCGDRHDDTVVRHIPHGLSCKWRSVRWYDSRYGTASRADVRREKRRLEKKRELEHRRAELDARIAALDE